MSTNEINAKKNNYRFDPEKIDWDTMSQIGLSKEQLEKYNLLEPMLKGYKSNQLIPIQLDLGIAVTRMDARLSLQEQPDGTVVVAMHGIRKEPNLHMPLFGHEFTPQDKENLVRTGNMGRVVDLVNPRTGETIPSIISLDRLTNDLVALGVSKMKIPDEVKGIPLSATQQEALKQGKAIFVEGMTSKKGTSFDAALQYNADKRSLEFLFDRKLNQAQKQNQEAPKNFRGQKLSEEQQQRLSQGEKVYIEGLIDKKGQSYQGYISFNKETRKTDFSFNNPNAVAKTTTPADSLHKTKGAVNVEGQTNDATKAIKEPLAKLQRQPKNPTQKEEQNTVKTSTSQSKGRKL